MQRVKLSNKRIQDFLKSAGIGQRLYDTETGGFHVRNLKTGGYFYLSYQTQLGKRRVMTIGRFSDKTCDQARDVAKTYVGRIITGEDVQETRQTDKTLAEKTGRQFLDKTYRALQSRKKTGGQTIQMIETYFSALLDKPLGELSEADIHVWQQRQESTEVKFTTIKRRYNAFKAMVNCAVRKKFVDVNPISAVILDPYPETEAQRVIRTARRSYLTQGQMQSFLQALDRYQDEKRTQRRNSRRHGKAELPDLDRLEFVDHVKPILLLLLYTGFRKGDAIGLRWEHVNFQFSTISKVVEKTAHHVQPIQHFPISAPLLDALKHWHRQSRFSPNGLVFPSSRTGGRLDETALQVPWRKIRQFAELPESLQLYSLRHNFASHLVMDGCDLLSVARLLGHSSIEMIVEHYGHLQPSLLQDYSNRFSEIVVANKNATQPLAIVN